MENKVIRWEDLRCICRNKAGKTERWATKRKYVVMAECGVVKLVVPNSIPIILSLEGRQKYL